MFKQCFKQVTILFILFACVNSNELTGNKYRRELGFDSLEMLNMPWYIIIRAELEMKALLHMKEMEKLKGIQKFKANQELMDARTKSKNNDGEKKQVEKLKQGASSPNFYKLRF